VKPSERISRGWCQNPGALYDGEGNEIACCALVAIIGCVADKEEGYRFVNVLRTYLPYDVVRWNDDKGRTQQEVIHMLEKVENTGDYTYVT